MQSTDTTKYIIHTKITADGVIERPDIVGAIFGQTEGLLGTDLDLRELQKTGRIGRIEVMTTSKAGKTRGNIFLPSGLDKVRTSVLAASLETIERVGPCLAKIDVIKIEDVRAAKRASIIERAKVIYASMFDEDLLESQEIADVVRESVRIEDITTYGKSKIPAGPNHDADTLIIVEGRADIINLLKYGIKNTISVGGTSIPADVAELTKTKKAVTVFTDGDRGGELIIRELLQVAKVDFVARPPDGKAVEDLVQKEIIQALRRKLPVDQYAEKNGLNYVRPLKAIRQTTSSKKTTIASRLMDKKPPKRITNIRKKTLQTQRNILDEEEEQYTDDLLYIEEQYKKKQNLEENFDKADKYFDFDEIDSNDWSGVDEDLIEENIQTAQERNSIEEEKITEEEKSFIEKNMNEISGTMSARLIDNHDNIVSEVTVRDLTNHLKKGVKDVKYLVFDGVITQRLVDVAAEQGIEEIAGLKIGSIVKKPANLKISAFQLY